MKEKDRSIDSLVNSIGLQRVLACVMDAAAVAALLKTVKMRELGIASLAFLGASVLFNYVCSLALCAWRAFLCPSCIRSVRRRNGSWAVVTGATDGIGYEYAIALRKLGFDVLIVSRTDAKLKQVKPSGNAAAFYCCFVVGHTHLISPASAATQPTRVVCLATRQPMPHVVPWTWSVLHSACFRSRTNRPPRPQVKADMEALPGTSGAVETLAIDFSKATEADYAKLRAFADKHSGDVAVLINNVGVSYPHAMYFHELDTPTIDALIKVASRFPSHVKCSLPSMASQSARHRSFAF